MEKGHHITPHLLTFSLLEGTEANLPHQISPLHHHCSAILGESCQQDREAYADEDHKLHPMDPNARSWVGPTCHWLWGSMAIEAKRPQHHLQASVPPAPSPVLHQASSCGLHLWPAEKPHRIELCLCQLTILAESEIGKSLTP